MLIGKALIASDFNPELCCMITVTSEHQAEKLKSFKIPNSKPKGAVNNNVKIFEFLPTTNKRVVSFQEIKLDKMVRTTRTNTVNIADEKYAFVCETNNLYKNCSRIEKLLTVSLPFIAIVHGNQESQAWAAVLWDNLEIIPDSELLNLPRVSWNNLAQQLSKKFDEIVKFPKKRFCDGSIEPTNEGRTLTEGNMRFLCFMAMNHPVNEEIPNDMSITWDAFFRDKLPGRNFSFWDWFYNAIKLVESLSTHWNNNIIFGFIDKATAISQLELDLYQPGTFILRFSETICGKF